MAEDTPDQMLFHAVKSGQLKGVQKALAAGASPVGAQIEDSMQRTALHFAAMQGKPVICDVLLKAGADVSAQDASEQTALQLAASDGYVDVIVLLAQHGANVEPRYGPSGRTPLHEAAASDQMDTVKALCGLGADTEARTAEGRTPLHIAARSGAENACHALLFAHKNSIDQVRARLASANKLGLGASKPKGADVDAKDKTGRTPMHEAATHGHLKICWKLFEAGADITVASDNGHAAVHEAARRGHAEVVRYFLHIKGPQSVDAMGRTIMHLAAEAGHSDVVQTLLSNGVHDDVADRAGNFAIHDAVLKGHVSVVRLLLEAGYDPNTKVSRGRTALHLAASSGQTEIATLLLEHGAPPNALSRTRATALHEAARYNHLDTVRVLVDHWAIIEVADGRGRTPLHLAALEGNLRVVRALLEIGADQNLLDNDEKTPAQVAHDHTRGVTAELLEVWAAATNTEGCSAAEAQDRLDELEHLLMAIEKQHDSFDLDRTSVFHPDPLEADRDMDEGGAAGGTDMDAAGGAAGPAPARAGAGSRPGTRGSGAGNGEEPSAAKAMVAAARKGEAAKQLTEKVRRQSRKVAADRIAIEEEETSAELELLKATLGKRQMSFIHQLELQEHEVEELAKLGDLKLLQLHEMRETADHESAEAKQVNATLRRQTVHLEQQPLIEEAAALDEQAANLHNRVVAETETDAIGVVSLSTAVST